MYSNNIVQSTDVATACLCNNLFKLSYPYGVIDGKDDDFVVADTTHEIMYLIALTIIPQTGNIILQKIGYKRGLRQ